MRAETVLDLYENLRADHRRALPPLSTDIQEANKLLHYPYALDKDLVEVMRQWCMKRQPCQFGRLAASKRQIHFCTLRETDLARGDDWITAKIAESKRLWKQRAIIDAAPPHGFMLVCASERIALAAPDDNLRRFSEKLLELTGWGPEQRHRGNCISSDYLFLKNPHDGMFYGFQFNVDFFAVAGDGRWWHDHRIPGGIAFTANSTGHMSHFKDWYEQPGSNHKEWAVKQAMITIAQSHPTAMTSAQDPKAEGRVTWLRSLDSFGNPLVAGLPCPLRSVPGQLQGKDWTRYEGVLHTDHAVRAEFFSERDKPETAEQPYLMDFTYLYDQSQADFVKFMAGVRVSEDDVYLETGRPNSWGTRDAADATMVRTSEQEAIAKDLLQRCQAWEPSSDYLTPTLSE